MLQSKENESEREREREKKKQNDGGFTSGEHFSVRSFNPSFLGRYRLNENTPVRLESEARPAVNTLSSPLLCWGEDTFF